MLTAHSRSAGLASTSSARQSSISELIHLSRTSRLPLSACTHALWRASGGRPESRQSLHSTRPGRCGPVCPRRSLAPLQASVLTSVSSSPAPSIMADPRGRARARSERLTKLVELRALYRDFIRAKTLLRLPTPVYTPPEDDRVRASPEESEDAEADLAYQKERELQEQERRKEAVEIVAEMQLTAEQLRSGLRTIPLGFGDIFPSVGSSPSPDDYESLIRDHAWKYMAELRERVAVELPLLPFPNLAAAQVALDARNARYTRSGPSSEGPSSPLPASSPGGSNSSSGASSPSGSSTPTGNSTGGILLPGGQDAAQQLASSIERLGQAEKVAEQFVATRIKPVLRKAREGELVDMVRETGVYLKGLWVRLNGGGSRVQEPALSPDLPFPTRSQKDTELAVSQLSLELDGIEARLREAARAREAKLRKVRAPEEGRATMPFQLKMMDEEVLKLSRELAVRMLQVEMEYVFGSLEDEVVDIASSDVGDLLRRQGSTTELRLLSVEFQYLDEQLAELAAQITPATASTSHAPTTTPSPSALQGAATAVAAAAAPGVHSAAAAAGGAVLGTGLGASTSGAYLASGGGGAMGDVVRLGGVPVSVEALLEALANEVPDMRQRVGVPDQVVFGGQGFSLTKARLQARDALDKLWEAIDFMTRGFKLLGSDIRAAARLFGKAAIGGTLKPREVSALRRTARDILTFIPFTIILIIPLSPLGHVLVFGFIQQYFPSFFPSCFTSKRQDLMVRYEELERQLLAARTQAEQVEEEAELVKAATAAATGSISLSSGGSGRRSASVNSTTSSPGGPGRGSGTGTNKLYSTEQGSGRGSGSSVNGSAIGGGGGMGAGAAAAILPSSSSPLGDAWKSLTSLDEAANVAVAAQTAQVRALEERMAAVLDDVTLGDDPSGSPSPTTIINTTINTAKKTAGGSDGTKNGRSSGGSTKN